MGFCIIFSSYAAVKPAGEAGTVQKSVVKLSPEKAILIDGKTFFPISVWQQPKYLFDYHKSLGINSILCPPKGENKKWFMDAAWEKGLYVFASYSEVFKDHPSILGWITVIDEGDIENTVAGLERVKRNDPDRLSYIHIGWDNVLDFNAGRASDYEKVFGKADTTCCHVFPMGRNNPDGLHMVGDVVDFMNKYSKNKIAPMIDIECAKLEKGERKGSAPSRDQVRCEIWEAIVHGAKGLCYFTISFEPFVWSQIPAQNEGVLKYNNNLIRDLKDVILLGKEDVILEKSADEGVELNVMAKRVEKDLYLFAVNTANKAGKIKLKLNEQYKIKEILNYERREEKLEFKNNLLEEEYSKYQVKIYKLTIE